mmetsp:Transcript_23478/g.70334  ORF Transcript_23478/g.70334 Transcript_23478/m.70334 type:complete len:221 (+) Transcript_23478:407-1069(+)
MARFVYSCACVVSAPLARRVSSIILPIHGQKIAFTINMTNRNTATSRLPLFHQRSGMTTTWMIAQPRYIRRACRPATDESMVPSTRAISTVQHMGHKSVSTCPKSPSIPLVNAAMDIAMLSHKRNAAVARNTRLYSAAGTSASSSGVLTPNFFCRVIICDCWLASSCCSASSSFLHCASIAAVALHLRRLPHCDRRARPQRLPQRLAASRAARAGAAPTY